MKYLKKFEGLSADDLLGQHDTHFHGSYNDLHTKSEEPENEEPEMVEPEVTEEKPKLSLNPDTLMDQTKRDFNGSKSSRIKNFLGFENK
jgi:hypothetical protein